MSGDAQQRIKAISKALNSIPGVIVNADGYIIHPYVTVKRIPAIGRRPLEALHGIVIHQSGGPTLASALSAAAQGGAAAHFYIDKDGGIYQAASLFRVCGHVGFLKPRCLIEHRCNPEEGKNLQRLYNAFASEAIHAHESKKDWPDRYPMNEDSIGIELVGWYVPRHPARGEIAVYDKVTERQNASLKWLIHVISRGYSARSYEIYRHPDISRKTPSEAATAKW